MLLSPCCSRASTSILLATTSRSCIVSQLRNTCYSYSISTLSEAARTPEQQSSRLQHRQVRPEGSYLHQDSGCGFCTHILANNRTLPLAAKVISIWVHTHTEMTICANTQSGLLCNASTLMLGKSAALHTRQHHTEFVCACAAPTYVSLYQRPTCAGMPGSPYTCSACQTTGCLCIHSSGFNSSYSAYKYT